MGLGVFGDVCNDQMALAQWREVELTRTFSWFLVGWEGRRASWPIAVGSWWRPDRRCVVRGRVRRSWPLQGTPGIRRPDEPSHESEFFRLGRYRRRPQAVHGVLGHWLSRGSADLRRGERCA